MNNILVVNPHPDDAEISMGMRIQEHTKRGDVVNEIILCKGELGGNPKEREREAEKTAKILGINKVWFFEHPNTRFDKTRNVLKNDIETIINEVRPSLIYGPWYKDEHIDHAVAGKELLVAARSIDTVIFYRCLRSIDFTPNFTCYYKQEFMDEKIKALKTYKSQINRSALNIDNAIITAKYWGLNSGHHLATKRIKKLQKFTKDEDLYAEPFHIHRCSNITVL